MTARAKAKAAAAVSGCSRPAGAEARQLLQLQPRLVQDKTRAPSMPTICALRLRFFARRVAGDKTCEAATFLSLPSLPLQLSDVSADSFVSSSLPPLAKLLAASHSRQHVPGQMDMLRIRHRLMTHACLGTMTCFPRESAREGGSEEETCVYASASGFHCRMLT